MYLTNLSVAYLLLLSQVSTIFLNGQPNEVQIKSVKDTQEQKVEFLYVMF